MAIENLIQSFDDEAARLNEFSKGLPKQVIPERPPTQLPELNEDGTIKNQLPPDVELELSFCPTGPGGGVDPSCGKSEGGEKQMVLFDKEAEHLVEERGIVVESCCIDE